MNSIKKMILSTCLIFVLYMMMPGMEIPYQVFADEGENENKSLEEQIEEWHEQGIDPNHTEVIEEMRAYIEENIADSRFASLHIDREERDLGVIVLSFTEPLEDVHRQELEALAAEPAKVEFRQVEYTEQELQQIQEEINKDVFEKDRFTNQGITVWHTGTDIINNQVEIGIEPYTKENARLIYEAYGEERVNVVEGERAQTLEDVADDQSGLPTDHEVNDTTGGATDQIEELNFLQRMFQSIGNWFKSLF